METAMANTSHPLPLSLIPFRGTKGFPIFLTRGSYIESCKLS
jgi:hypothetical protein